MKTRILLIISTLFLLNTNYSFSDDFMNEFLKHDIKEFTIFREPLEGDTTKIIGMKFISDEKDNLINSYKTESKSILKSDLRNLLSNDLIIDIDSLELLSYFDEGLKEQYVNTMYSNMLNYCVDNRPTEIEYKDAVRKELKRLDTISKETIKFILEYPDDNRKQSTNINIEIINKNSDTLKIYSRNNPAMSPFSLPWILEDNEEEIETYNINLYLYFSNLYWGKVNDNNAHYGLFYGFYTFMSKVRRVFIKEGIIKIPPPKYDE